MNLKKAVELGFSLKKTADFEQAEHNVVVEQVVAHIEVVLKKHFAHIFEFEADYETSQFEHM